MTKQKRRPAAAKVSLEKGATRPTLAVEPSPGLAGWLAERRIALAFTTYRVGKLFMIGTQPNGRLSIFERSLDRCMGLAVHGQSLFVGTQHQIWRFEDALEPGQDSGGFDRVYLPRVGHVTGDVNIHDIAVDRNDRPVFVNTLFSCLATTSETHSFVPLWKPPFVSKLGPQDRCHLNGLAMRDGLPAFVTAVAESDEPEGWREHRADGGCVVDMEDDDIVLRGLSMPHSPRWYDDRLWLHNSGTGEFGAADLKTGSFEPVSFCPGFLRGLDFAGDFAVMGLSKPRDSGAFTGLALEEALARRKADAQCALQVIDLRSGKVAHSLSIEGVVEEIYDVAILPETLRPMAIGFQGDDINRVITVGA
ncbi:MAG: TIGR03032 family protein [Inquilinus sp.]|nr:TIGR03032 family protein [Inquilinus sp.]